MQLGQAWNDVYGSVLAHYQGRRGGRELLLVCPPEQAQGASDLLAELEAKGAVWLMVPAGLTPLQAALRELQPRAVVVLGPELGGGAAWKAGHSAPAPEPQAGELQAAEHPAEEAADPAYLPFTEPGALPEWRSAHPLPGAPQGVCPQAALAASLGYPVTVCALERLPELLPAHGMAPLPR